MMNRSIPAVLVILALASAWACDVRAQKPENVKGAAYYKKKHYDPVLEDMKKKREAAAETAAEETARIREAQAKRDEEEKETRRVLTFDMGDIRVPESPDRFESAFHFPPVPQYYTGTCWCFATTSFLESEVSRRTGRKIKLSEMYTVYYEYLEKVRRWVRERGDSYVAEGSETNAVLRIWDAYGVVPRAAYEGVRAEDGRYDHEPMMEEIEAWLDRVEAHDLWDEEAVVDAVRLILNRHMGAPPAEFEWDGARYTPVRFMKEVLEIRPADYVHVISTLEFPFYTFGEYKVPDNWWRSEDWYNLPLDEWYGVVRNAAKNGYTVAIGGDVSEPGYQGFEDAAVVAPFDIPGEFIDQDAREFRFYNRSSTDDHALHLVGHTRHGGADWFLIKDSARSSRWGDFEGYYFYRSDYVKLKMLSFTVHRDMMENVMK